MGLFSPNKDKEAAQQGATEPETQDDSATAPKAKSVPTPKRRDAEAARRQRLNPQLSPKEARKRARDEAAADRRKQMEAVEKHPGRELMRNWVDSRTSMAEWSMPVLMALLAVVLVITPMYPGLVEPFTYATWAFMCLVIVDIWMMWRGFKRLAAERIPREPLKGLFYYGFNRSLSLRRIRVPRPVVKRGDKI